MSRAASFGQVVKFSAKNIDKHRNIEKIQDSGQNMQCQTLTSNLLTTVSTAKIVNMASILKINQSKSLFPQTYGLTNLATDILSHFYLSCPSVPVL